MKIWTIEEVKEFLEDCKIISQEIESEDQKWINRLKSNELKNDILWCYSEREGLGEDKAGEAFTELIIKKYISKIDLTIFTEETKGVFLNLLEFFDITYFNIKEIKDINKLEKVLKLAENDPYLIANIWENVDKELKRENPELFSKIIEYVKGKPDVIGKIWINTDKEVQKEQANLLIEIIEKEGKVRQITLFRRIIELVKEDSNVIGEIWINTDKEIQKKRIEELIEKFKEKPDIIGEIWINTVKEVQRENAFLFSTIIEYVKGKPDVIGKIWKNTDKEIQKASIVEVIDVLNESEIRTIGIWEDTDKEVQRDNAKLFCEIIENVKEFIKQYPFDFGVTWQNTDKEIQKETILEVIDQFKEKSDVIGEIWQNTDKEVQRENIKDLLEQTRIKAISFSIVGIIQNSDSSILKDIWKLLSTEEKKEYFETIIDRVTKDSELCKDLPEILETIDKNLDTDRLSRILTMKDNEYLNKYVAKEILIKNIGNQSIDIEQVNGEIEKIFNIFFTNNLPEVFKLFEFFKFHRNHEYGENDKLYKGKTKEERDKIILSDLIVSSLDSNNNQFRNFLELLYNGNLAYTKLKNGHELDDLDKSFLSSYSDTLVSLYNLLKSDKIKNENDYLQNIKNIYSNLNLDETKDIGSQLLIQFFKQLDLDFSKYGEKLDAICENLLFFMENKRKEANETNRKNTDVKSLLEKRRFNKGNIN